MASITNVYDNPEKPLSGRPHSSSRQVAFCEVPNAISPTWCQTQSPGDENGGRMAIPAAAETVHMNQAAPSENSSPGPALVGLLAEEDKQTKAARRPSRKWRLYGFGMLGIIIIAVIFIILFYFAVLPGLVQNMVNRSTLSLTSVIISSPKENSFEISLAGVLQRVGVRADTFAVMAPTEYEVFYKPLPPTTHLDRPAEIAGEVEDPHDDHEGHDHEGHRRLSMNGGGESTIFLGHFQLPELTMHEAETSFNTTTTFHVSNLGAFDAFVLDLMQEDMQWFLQATTAITTQGRQVKGITMSKTVSLRKLQMPGRDADIRIEDVQATGFGNGMLGVLAEIGVGYRNDNNLGVKSIGGASFLLMNQEKTSGRCQLPDITIPNHSYVVLKLHCDMQIPVTAVSTILHEGITFNVLGESSDSPLFRRGIQALSFPLHLDEVAVEGEKELGGCMGDPQCIKDNEGDTIPDWDTQGDDSLVIGIPAFDDSPADDWPDSFLEDPQDVISGLMQNHKDRPNSGPDTGSSSPVEEGTAGYETGAAIGGVVDGIVERLTGAPVKDLIGGFIERMNWGPVESKPDSSKPDASKPDTSRPDSSKPDNGVNEIAIGEIIDDQKGTEEPKEQSVSESVITYAKESPAEKPSDTEGKGDLDRVTEVTGQSSTPIPLRTTSVKTTGKDVEAKDIEAPKNIEAPKTDEVIEAKDIETPKNIETKDDEAPKPMTDDLKGEITKADWEDVVRQRYAMFLDDPEAFAALVGDPEIQVLRVDSETGMPMDILSGQEEAGGFDAPPSKNAKAFEESIDSENSNGQPLSVQELRTAAPPAAVPSPHWETTKRWILDDAPATTRLLKEKSTKAKIFDLISVKMAVPEKAIVLDEYDVNDAIKRYDSASVRTARAETTFTVVTRAKERVHVGLTRALVHGRVFLDEKMKEYLGTFVGSLKSDLRPIYPGIELPTGIFETRLSGLPIEGTLTLDKNNENTNRFLASLTESPTVNLYWTMEGEVLLFVVREGGSSSIPITLALTRQSPLLIHVQGMPRASITTKAETKFLSAGKKDA